MKLMMSIEWHQEENEICQNESYHFLFEIAWRGEELKKQGDAKVRRREVGKHELRVGSAERAVERRHFVDVEHVRLVLHDLAAQERRIGRRGRSRERAST